MIHFNGPGIIEIINVILHFSLLFLNIDISVTICVINLKFSLRVPKDFLNGCLSRISHLGLTIYFLSKIG